MDNDTDHLGDETTLDKNKNYKYLQKIISLKILKFRKTAYVMGPFVNLIFVV